MDYNKVLKKLVKEQINILASQKNTLEINKNFRKIPLSLKESYYYGYDVAMDGLYEVLNDITRGVDVTLEEYQDVLDIISVVEDYLINILDSYEIKYDVI